MESLRILMTAEMYPPTHIGGDAVHLEALSNQLVERGHEVHVLTSSHPFALETWQKTSTRSRTGPVRVHDASSPWGRLQPLGTFVSGHSSSANRLFAHLLRTTKPDLVHHHNMALLGHDLLRAGRDQLQIHTAHSLYLVCPKQTLLRPDGTSCPEPECFTCLIRSGRPPQLWRSRPSFEQAIRELSLILSPSEYIRGLLDRCGVPITVIPMFVENHRAEAHQPGYPYFLFAGRLDFSKGPDILIGAFRSVATELPDHHLLIAGAGRSRDELVSMSRKKFRDRIHFLGWQDPNDLARYFAGATAVIIPSRVPENSPLVALEAFAQGTPVIASNRGGLPELISPETGLCFEPESISGLCRALIEVTESRFDPRSIYLERHQPQKYLERYETIIKNLIPSDFAHRAS